MSDTLDLGSLVETTRPITISGKNYRARELTMQESVYMDRLYHTISEGGNEGVRALTELQDMLLTIIKGIDRSIVLRLDAMQLATLQRYISPFIYNNVEYPDDSGPKVDE